MSLNRMTRTILSLLLISAVVLPASGDSYSLLFIIERSTNKNVIHYDAKFGKDGKLDPKNPVVAYWIMAAEDGRRESLSAPREIPFDTRRCPPGR